jgi:hypothetical protein
MSMHVEGELLAAYARGDVDAAHAYSIEVHVVACADCQVAIGRLVAADRLEGVWADVEDRLDAPRIGPMEAVLMRVGVREHLARLLVTTPSLRLSWLGACALVLAFAAWAAGERDEGVYWFLVLAPLLPLAGVAAAYGPDVDPTYEVGLAAPTSSFALLLIRALAVIVTTTAMILFSSLALPGLHWTAGAWLLPSLGLTLASLVLATRMPPIAACGSLAVAWMLATAAGWGLAPEPLELFGPTAQFAWAPVAVVAALVLVRNADDFERRGDLA